MRTEAIIITITVLLLPIVSPAVTAQDVELVHRMRAAIDSGSVTQEYLQNPANRDIVDELRRRALYSSDIACILLRADDERSITLSLEKINSGDQIQAAAIGCAGNPKLISPLMNLVFTDESPEKVRAGNPGDKYSITPISVSAAFTIARLLANSDKFPPPVHSWANNLIHTREAHAGDRRKAVRRWWTENKDLMVAGRYNETRPPSNP